MDALRKILILLLTFVAVVLVFVALNRMTDTPEIDPTAAAGDEKIEVPDLDSEGGQIGDVKVGTVERSRFVSRDPLTGDISRVFGYDEIRNPEEGQDRWGVVMPYMQIFEDKFTCDIEARSGQIEIETIAGKPVPGDAQLSGDVVITLKPNGDGGMQETTIYLDVLDYYSERSEFSTAGPVKIVSADGEMVGTGMVLIYNAQVGRIEDLRIHDLEYMRFRRQSGVAAAEDEAKAGEDGEKAGIATADQKRGERAVPVASVDETDRNADRSRGVAKPAASQADESRQAAVEKSGLDDAGVAVKKGYGYECRLLDNVSIRYGDQFTIVNADEVRIVNMLWAGGRGQSAEGKSAGSDGETDVSAANTETPKKPQVSGVGEPSEAVAAAGETKPALSQVTGEKGKSEPAAETDGKADAVEILVRCDGGVVITPMDKVVAEGAKVPEGRWIEFSGGPVRVNELAGGDDPIGRTIATGGQIKYDVDEEVLDLMTSPAQKLVTLSLADGTAGLETQGNVKWRKNRANAVIDGPGRLWTAQKSAAEADAQQDTSGTEMVFGGTMELAFANAADPAAGGDVTLKQADFSGGVTATNGKSVMSAQTAEFAFNEAGDVESVDLRDAVSFASEKGRLQCDRALILFAMSDAGRMEPSELRSKGNAVLEPAVKEGEKPAKFGAAGLNYDIINGDAVAAGPVEFEFYMPEENAAGQKKASDVPVVITAEENAKYFAAGSVEFNGNVVGVRREQTGENLRESKFYGDKLVVAFAEPTADGQEPTVSNIEVTGDGVKLESVQFAGEKKISHVRLLCSQFDYDAIGQVVVAEGPGQIEINNEGASKKGTAGAGPDLSGPCFASISGFEKLDWRIDEQQVVADGGDKQVNMGYLPIVDGEFGSKVLASARDITVNFHKDEAGGLELGSLAADGGVYYEEAGGNFFKGDKLRFDGLDSVMIVSGTEDDPCFANGARVPRVEYNLKTGEVKTSISVTPGSLDANRAGGKRLR